MGVGAVDRSDPVPLHHQVRMAVLSLIRESGLQPGDQLPPEPALCERFQVSRQTLRQAVDQLVQEHVLYRQRPKGTFVGFGAVEGDLQDLRSVWEDLRRLGMEPTVQLLAAEKRPAGDAAVFLEVSPGREVLELRRVFSADGAPISYDVAYFALPEFDWLLAEDLTSSWHELLRSRRGIVVAYARTVVEATIASPEVAGHLDVAPGSALLHLRRQTYAHNDQLISYSSALYRSDRYHFSVTLSRRSSTSPTATFEL
jgi:GntR family transcriptional regulator